MSKYLVMKNNIPVATSNSSEEADKLYMQYNADDIQEIDNVK